MLYLGIANSQIVWCNTTTSINYGKGVVVVVKKVLTWGGLAFLLFFIAYQPNSAAKVFRNLGSEIGEMAEGLATFFTSLVA